MVEMLLTVWWMLHRGRRMVVIVRWARRVVGVLVVSLGRVQVEVGCGWGLYVRRVWWGSPWIQSCQWNQCIVGNDRVMVLGAGMVLEGLLGDQQTHCWGS